MDKGSFVESNARVYLDMDTSVSSSPFPKSKMSQQNYQSSSRSKKRKSTASPEREFLDLARKTLETNLHNDKHDLFGQYVAKTLQEMSPEQQIFAEKLMSDVLFQGRCGHLSKDTCLKTDEK